MVGPSFCNVSIELAEVRGVNAYAIVRVLDKVKVTEDDVVVVGGGG